MTNSENYLFVGKLVPLDGIQMRTDRAGSDEFPEGYLETGSDEPGRGSDGSDMNREEIQICKYVSYGSLRPHL
mgnify:CR=1 FL=1